MKIRKLRIKNYKVFDDVIFDFTDGYGKTLNTVVLAGVNGCGKTTVLEVVMQILTNDFETKSISEVAAEFDVSEHSGSWLQNRLIQTHYPIFSTLDEPKFSSLLYTNLFEHHQLVYFPASEKDANRSLFSKKAPRNVINLYLTRQKNELKELALKQIRDEVFKNKNLPPKQIIDNQIKNITRSLADLDLNTRLVDLESEELVFESINGQRIHFEQLSHGEQHLYFRAIYLSQLNIKDGIIMIDEPEAAFHPTWQQKIAQLYRNVGENNQVFMATHSPHIMASVPPECLFILHIDEKTRKVQVVNAAKAGKHSQGLEPNRILKEVMQVDTLRDYETQRDIERMAELLTPDNFESKEAVNLAEKLTAQLGRQDPFIIRMEHQLLMLRRKKSDLTVA